MGTLLVDTRVYIAHNIFMSIERGPEQEVQSPLEQAKERFGSSMFAAFGVVGEHGEQRCIEYPIVRGDSASPEKDSLAEQAVIELFESGAQYHELLAKEKSSGMSEYSDEALSLERDAHRYRVAADYVKGLRKEDSSKLIADEVFTEYYKSAEKSITDFLKMQLAQVPKEKLLFPDQDSAEYKTYQKLADNSGLQLTKALAYITRGFNLEYISIPSDKTLQEKFSVETPIKPIKPIGTPSPEMSNA